jgi:hypothetical protein
VDEDSRLDHVEAGKQGLATALGWIRTCHWPFSNHLFTWSTGPETLFGPVAW